MRLSGFTFVKKTWQVYSCSMRSLGSQLIEFTLQTRLNLRKLFPARGNVFESLNPFEIPVVVINLKKRRDRLDQVMIELEKVGFHNVLILEAIDGRASFPHLLPGHASNLGCTLSHLKAIESYFEDDIPVAICEDDNQFLGSRESISTLVREFLDSNSQDVLGLSVRVRGRKIEASEKMNMVGWALAPAFYILKPRAKNHLLKALRRSAVLLKNQKRGGPFDQVWRWPQRFHLNFVVPKERVARQRESFSDIQGKYFSGT